MGRGERADGKIEPAIGFGPDIHSKTPILRYLGLVDDYLPHLLDSFDQRFVRSGVISRDFANQAVDP